MSVETYKTSTEEETVALGKQLAPRFPKPSVVLLVGNLGAGKTTLVKGIASGLGAAEPDEVTSPTFTLIHEYGSDLYHIDLYRLDTADEVRSLGLDDLFDRDAIVLIEWGERFPALLPPDPVEIRIEIEGDERQISVRYPQGG